MALRLLALGIGLVQNGSKMQASVVPLTPVVVRSWGTGGSGFGPAVGRDRCFRTRATARRVDLKWGRTRLLFVHFGVRRQDHAAGGASTSGGAMISSPRQHSNQATAYALVQAHDAARGLLNAALIGALCWSLIGVLGWALA